MNGKQNICNKIYDDINLKNSTDRVILAPHNEDTKLINNKVLNLLFGDSHTYYSLDYATHKVIDQTDENIHLNYPVEMLNNIREGLPQHELKLKINAIVMLIRNISITEGMCNGTRLKITGLFNHNIKVMCNPKFNIFLNQDSNIYSKKKFVSTSVHVNTMCRFFSGKFYGYLCELYLF